MVVSPGSGWSSDPATRSTPVAHSRAEVQRLAQSATNFSQLDARVSVCRTCPRLVQWREQVAETKRAAFADQQYWGRPIPGFGPANARIAVLGLAPAAHGGNRTSRMFTGDRSGDWLYAALYRVGLANQPTAVDANDGLTLSGVRIVASVRCAPPANKPTPVERDNCQGWLVREFELMTQLRVIVVLGAFAWQALWPALHAAGVEVPARRPAFAHGEQVELADHQRQYVLGCYHVSQQNTFTGRLTEQMLDSVLIRARNLASF